MKLDEPISEQRLGLDITPLIDVVFLLVLFFAVTTSFITPEDLSALKTDLFVITEDNRLLTQEKERLSAEREAMDQQLRRQEEEIARLEQEYANASRDYEAKLAANQERIEALRAAVREAENERARTQWMVAALQEEQSTLTKRLSERDEEVKSIESQLQEAYQNYEALNVEIAAVRERNETLADTERALRGRIAELERDLDRYKSISELDPEQIERLLQAQEQLRAGLATSLRNRDIGLVQEKQRLVLQLSSQILFDSGSAVLRPPGIEVLKEVGGLLRDRIGELDVQIAGHTDNVPIVSDGEGSYPNNWALSAARAVNVVTFLEEEVGIAAGKLSAVAYGEHRPITLNDTPEGRARNRRIEVVLLPQ